MATINRLKPLDADFIRALALRCLELVDYKNLKADQTARYNFGKRLAGEANRTQTCYNLATHTDSLAMIKHNDVEEWVKSEIICRLAGDRIELLLPTADEFVDGAFVFYICEPSNGAAPESGVDEEP